MHIGSRLTKSLGVADRMEALTMAKITINGITVDPLAEGPALAAAEMVTADASSSNYILIQTRQPLDQAHRAELAGKGVVILEYVPDNTYLCLFPPSNLNEIRALPYVAWANVYMKGFKVGPTLAVLPPGGPRVRNLLEVATLPERTLSNAPKTVEVVFHRNVDPNTVRDKLAAAARIDPADLKLSPHKVRLTVQTRYLPDLAAIDEVRNIEEAVPKKLHNNVARQILRVELNPGPGPTFEGDGQIVAVADTGFDLGSTSDVHPAFQGRVAKLYALGRPNKAEVPDVHGTHVAGSVLGDGTSSPLGISIRGTAPKARLVFQSVLDSSGGLGGLPDDLHDLFKTPYDQDGARIHTNSPGNTTVFRSSTLFTSF